MYKLTLFPFHSNPSEHPINNNCRLGSVCRRRDLLKAIAEYLSKRWINFYAWRKFCLPHGYYQFTRDYDKCASLTAINFEPFVASPAVEWSTRSALTHTRFGKLCPDIDRIEWEVVYGAEADTMGI